MRTKMFSRQGQQQQQTNKQTKSSVTAEMFFISQVYQLDADKYGFLVPTMT